MRKVCFIILLFRVLSYSQDTVSFYSKGMKWVILDNIKSPGVIQNEKRASTLISVNYSYRDSTKGIYTNSNINSSNREVIDSNLILFRNIVDGVDFYIQHTFNSITFIIKLNSNADTTIYTDGEYNFFLNWITTNKTYNKGQPVDYLFAEIARKNAVSATTRIVLNNLYYFGADFSAYHTFYLDVDVIPYSKLFAVYPYPLKGDYPLSTIYSDYVYSSQSGKEYRHGCYNYSLTHKTTYGAVSAIYYYYNNEDNYVFSDEITFTTPDRPPYFEVSFSNITYNSAHSTIKIYCFGNSYTGWVRFGQYTANKSCTDYSIVREFSGSEDQTIEIDYTGLNPNTKYFQCIEATSSAGTNGVSDIFSTTFLGDFSNKAVYISNFHTP